MQQQLCQSLQRRGPCKTSQGFVDTLEGALINDDDNNEDEDEDHCNSSFGNHCRDKGNAKQVRKMLAMTS